MTKEEKIKEAIKTIVEYNRDSAYVQHFKVEYGEPQDEGFSKLMYDDMIELLSLLSLQGDSCNSIGTKLILFKKAASFEILSPLKFTDDEWNELAYGKPNEYQNNRLSSVFKKGEKIYDIHALTYNRIGRYEMHDLKYEVDKASYSFNGTAILYDENSSEYHVYRPLISNTETYLGENYCTMPIVELYDRTDDKNDFFCNISSISNVPEKFYKDYELVVDEELEERLSEKLEYCRRNDIYKTIVNQIKLKNYD